MKYLGKINLKRGSSSEWSKKDFVITEDCEFTCRIGEGHRLDAYRTQFGVDVAPTEEYAAGTVVGILHKNEFDDGAIKPGIYRVDTEEDAENIQRSYFGIYFVPHARLKATGTTPTKVTASTLSGIMSECVELAEYVMLTDESGYDIVYTYKDELSPTGGFGGRYSTGSILMQSVEVLAYGQPGVVYTTTGTKLKIGPKTSETSSLGDCGLTPWDEIPYVTVTPAFEEQLTVSHKDGLKVAKGTIKVWKDDLKYTTSSTELGWDTLTFKDARAAALIVTKNGIGLDRPDKTGSDTKWVDFRDEDFVKLSPGIKTDKAHSVSEMWFGPDDDDVALKVITSGSLVPKSSPTDPSLTLTSSIRLLFSNRLSASNASTLRSWMYQSPCLDIVPTFGTGATNPVQFVHIQKPTVDGTSIYSGTAIPKVHIGRRGNPMDGVHTKWLSIDDKVTLANKPTVEGIAHLTGSNIQVDNGFYLWAGMPTTTSYHQDRPYIKFNCTTTKDELVLNGATNITVQTDQLLLKTTNYFARTGTTSTYNSHSIKYYTNNDDTRAYFEPQRSDTIRYALLGSPVEPWSRTYSRSLFMPANDEGQDGQGVPPALNKDAVRGAFIRSISGSKCLRYDGTTGLEIGVAPKGETDKNLAAYDEDTLPKIHIECSPSNNALVVIPGNEDSDPTLEVSRLKHPLYLGFHAGTISAEMTKKAIYEYFIRNVYTYYIAVGRSIYPYRADCGDGTIASNNEQSITLGSSGERWDYIYTTNLSTTNDVRTASDRRAKVEIKYVDESDTLLSRDRIYSFIKQLRPTTFKIKPTRWSKESVEDVPYQLGFIAQDMQDIDEEVFNGVGTISECDPDDIYTDGKAYSLKGLSVTTAAIVAIQELTKENEELRDRLDAIEKKLASLL